MPIALTAEFADDSALSNAVELTVGWTGGQLARGALPESVLKEIDSSLPDTLPLDRAILSIRPDVLSIAFGPKSDVPVAIVCLEDSMSATVQARYALAECIAHGCYFREHVETPDETGAIYFERFYADDVALRLYAAGEHLASAIVCMLQLQDEDLAPYRDGVTSLQARVGRFLLDKRPGSCLALAIERLVDSSDWVETIRYRGQWTHDQPPLVAGLGELYERRRRWEETEQGHQIGVGGGDAPALTTADLREMVSAAWKVFLESLGATYRCYLRILEERGLKLRDDGDRTGLDVDFDGERAS